MASGRAKKDDDGKQALPRPLQCNYRKSAAWVLHCTALLCSAATRGRAVAWRRQIIAASGGERAALSRPAPPPIGDSHDAAALSRDLDSLAVWAWLWLGECGQALVFTSLLACYASTLPLLAVRP